MRLTPGQVFNSLTVISQAENRHGKLMWNCLCVCGAAKLAMGLRLISGKTNSCGCKTKGGATLTHGQSKTATYHAWSVMKGVCHNPGHPQYHNHGGCGSTVCDEWRSFEGFFKDMGARPEGAVLRRYKKTQPFSKVNCHWFLKEVKGEVLYQGEILTIAKFAAKLGRSAELVAKRLSNGSSPDDLAVLATFNPLNRRSTSK